MRSVLAAIDFVLVSAMEVLICWLFLDYWFLIYYFKHFTFMKKDLLVIAIKVAIYALGLVAAYLGVTSLSSCTFSRSSVAEGRATIITTDTTIISHQGVLKTK